MTEKQIKFIDNHIAGKYIALNKQFSKKQREYKNYNLKDYKKFLIIRPGGIGDAVLLLPLLKFLKSNRKEVDILCMDRNKGMFNVYKKQGLLNEIYKLSSIKDFKKCRNNYDCLLDTEQSFNLSAIIARLIKPKLIIGFDTNDRRYIYNSFVHYSQEEYEGQSFLNLLKPFGIFINLIREDLTLNKLIDTDIKIKTKNNIGIFMGASIEARKLSPSFIEKVLKNMPNKFDNIFIIGGEEDFEDGEKLKENFINAKNYCGKTNIEGTIFILQHCKAFIGSDSGPLHMAVVSGINNILGVFGPGIDTKWAKDNIVKVLKKDVVCRPCNYGRFSQTPYCPYGFECLKNLEYKKAIKLLIN